MRVNASVLPDPATPFGRRVRARLRDDTVAWLTTVGSDGTPQPNPVWFLSEEDGNVLVYNRPDAGRLRHVRTRPRVAVSFDGDGLAPEFADGSWQRVRDAIYEAHGA